MRFIRYALLTALILLTSSLLIFAHGDEPHDEPEPAASVTVDFVPTYYGDVKPILSENCIGCHTPGQIAGDIDLTDDFVVQSSADDLAYLTSIRYMPPWMPSQDSLPMQHDRSLSEYDIAVIAAWMEAGAPSGEAGDYVEPEAHYNLAEVRADQILQLDEGYMPEEGVDDDYRCFAFTPDVDVPVFLTGYDFLPDVAAQVHHGIVYLVDDSALADITRNDGADGRPGWSCYTGTGVNSSREEFVGTWAPGTLPTLFPAGTGYKVLPDDIFIVQIHYNLLQGRQADRTAVHMQYEAGDSDLLKLATFELQGPVEIPCPTGVEGEQCEREWAIQRATELYGENWINFRPDHLLNECGQTITDYADNVGEDATTHCDYDIPLPLTVLGAFGHLHELGKSFQLELNPDTDDALMVLDIPAWDFHWQDRYQFQEPLQVTFGDVLRMTCNWDNTLSDDPRYVVWGEGTRDEMCFATLMVIDPRP